MNTTNKNNVLFFCATFSQVSLFLQHYRYWSSGAKILPVAVTDSSFNWLIHLCRPPHCVSQSERLYCYLCCSFFIYTTAFCLHFYEYVPCAVFMFISETILGNLIIIITRRSIQSIFIVYKM